MNQLNVAIIQTELFWENKQANYAQMEEMIMGVQSPVDLIVLPEMFNTGFSMNVDSMAEPMNLHTTKWMKQIAMSVKSVVAGSFIVKEKGIFFNRFLAIGSKGEILCQYDKQYLFPLSFEHTTFECGRSQSTFEVKGFTIKPQICYDLRFPESARYSNKYPQDVLVYVANWPSKRQEHWDVLLKARAIENQCFVVACNRIGDDENGLNYIGGSQVVSSEGNQLCVSNKDEVLLVQLTKENQDLYREKFPIIKSIKE